MQVTGMLHGARLLQFVGFPTPEVLGPDASESQIRALLAKHGLVFVKPVFKGGVGKKGKAGLIGKARDLKAALAEKERLYFAEHRHGNVKAKANGVSFEGGVPAEHEVSIVNADTRTARALAEKRTAGHCKITEYKADGNVVTYAMVCGTTTTRSTATYHGDSSEADLKTKAEGAAEVASHISAKRLGVCPQVKITK